MIDILNKIIAHKKQEINSLKKIRTLKQIENSAKKNMSKPTKSFINHMQKKFSIIAEIKKGSPSKGIIRSQFHPYAIAREYMESNVDAISILTDQKFFFGKPEYLKKIAKFSTVPLLRKDFIIDEYQIYESKSLGADIILLIASILSLSQLKDYLQLASELKMEVLTEVHTKKELDKVLKTDASIIGINNRNLKNFKIDLKKGVKLKPFIPKNRFAISESGIHSIDDIRLMRDSGFNGVLIGESFMRSKTIKKQVKLFQKG